MILETCLMILNIGEKATKLFDWFTGISSGKKMKATVSDLAKSNSKIERLSDRILYAPDLHQAINREGSMFLNSPKQVYDLVNPVAESLETDILTSAVVSTHEKLRKAFNKDPWELLIDVRPANRTKRPANPDLIPVSFRDDNLHYIGWQMRGALPSLFNCEFEYNDNLYLPPKETRKIVETENKEEKINLMTFDGLEYLIKRSDGSFWGADETSESGQLIINSHSIYFKNKKELLVMKNIVRIEYIKGENGNLDYIAIHYRVDNLNFGLTRLFTKRNLIFDFKNIVAPIYNQINMFVQKDQFYGMYKS